METPIQNRETNELSESKKNSIRLEEIYRQQIKESLEKPGGDKSSTNPVWKFLNSSLGIWFLSTCIVGAITFFYSQHQQYIQREADAARQKEQKIAAQRQNQIDEARHNASMVIVLLPYLASSDSTQWKMAFAVTRFLNDKGELPGELSSALLGIAGTKSTKPVERAKASAAVAVLDTKPFVGQTKPTDAVSLPPRVYIQIGLAEQRSPLAKSIQAALEQQNFLVPGIENVGIKGANVPNKTEVRYYFDEDKTGAQSILSILQRLNLNLQLDLTPKRINGGSGARPKHYELWISKS